MSLLVFKFVILGEVSSESQELLGRRAAEAMSIAARLSISFARRAFLNRNVFSARMTASEVTAAAARLPGGTGFSRKRARLAAAIYYVVGSRWSDFHGSLAASDNKKGQAESARPFTGVVLTSARRLRGRKCTRSGNLEVAGSHLARLVVALHVVANFWPSTISRIPARSTAEICTNSSGAALVRLDETETFGGIEPFDCASGHDEPSHSIIKYPRCECAANLVTILKRRSRRGAVPIAR